MKKALFFTMLIIMCALAVLLVGCSSSPEGMSILTEPKSVEITQGMAPDLSGGEVVVKYKNGSTKTISMTELEIRGVDLDVLGEQTAVLVYTEKGRSFSVTMKVNVVLPAVESITLDAASVKKEYIEGEYFSKNGLKVTARYINGSSAEVGAGAYSVTPSVLTVGTTSVRVNYRKAYADIPVTVRKKTPSSVSVEVAPEKTDYYEGENFDPEGIEVKVVYDNGTEKASIQKEYLSFLREDGTPYAGESLVTEDKAVIVCYEENDVVRTCSLTISVRPMIIEALWRDPNANPVECYAGIPFDVELIPSFYIIYDGIFSEIDPTSENFAASDAAVELEQTAVTIWLRSNPTVTLSVKVRVLPDEPLAGEIIDSPEKNEYSLGDAPDLTGLRCRVRFVSGYVKEFAAEELTTQEEVLTMDVTALHILYDGTCVLTYPVIVFDTSRDLDCVEIAEETEIKTDYTVGDEVESFVGKKFLFAFTNGDVETVTLNADDITVRLIVAGEKVESEVILEGTTEIVVSIRYTDQRGVALEGEYSIYLE